MPTASHHLSIHSTVCGTKRIALTIVPPVPQHLLLSPTTSHLLAEARVFCAPQTLAMCDPTWIFILFIAFLLYKYWTVKYSYWIHQNVPQLAAVPILGSFVPTNKPLQELELEFYKKHGRVYGRYDGSTPVLSVAEPELLKRILVKDFHLFSNRRDIKFNDPVVDNTLFSLEGEDWKRVRSIVSPTLTSAKLKRMLPLMEDCSEILIHNIQDTLKEKRVIQSQRFFGAFVIDTIAKCAFGISINSLTSENHPFVLKAKRLLECSFGWRTILTMICPKVMKLLSIPLLNPETTQFYKKVILNVMEEKRKVKGREDFLQLLLDNQVPDTVQDQNNNNIKEKCDDITSDGMSNYATSSVKDHVTSETSTHASLNNHHSSINYHASINHQSSSTINNQNRALSHDEIVAQCVTFFMAGYDATTSLLTYAMYNLAMHQDYQERAFEEIDAVLKDHDGELNYEVLSKLKFLEAILNECLRLCPPMVRNERRVMSDCVLGDSNIRLKKGMLISIPLYAMHRDPEWFPEPDEFRPERFYEPDPSRPQYVHMPFGSGPRICVGFRFVMMQVKLCLAKVLLKFRVQPGETTPANLGITEVRNVLKVEEVELSLVDREECGSENSWQLIDDDECSSV